MARRVAYVWRTFRTGLGFGVFGAGAFIAALCILPFARWLPGDRERRAQRIVHLTCRLWVRFAIALGLFRVQWNGVDGLRSRDPFVVVANHPTLIDIVLLIACMPQADCVVKRAAWRNPLLRWVVSGAGYIRNDGGGALIETCVDRLRRGHRLVLFPEGTRSPARRLGPFHRGAAHVALRSGVPLLPVVITCEPPTLLKGQRWYHVPDRTVQFTVQVNRPLRPIEISEGITEGIAARRLTAEMREFYERRLVHVQA